MPRYYMRVEAVNLDHFVYDTHDISTIRGGSFILLDVIDQLQTHFYKRLHPVTVAASQGLFYFDNIDDSICESLRAEVLIFLQRQTKKQATFVVAIEQEIADDFPLVLEKLEANVHRQQWLRPTVTIPEYSPTDQECFLDGWRPGTISYTGDPEVQNAKISVATDLRRKQGREIKHKLFHTLLEDDDYEDNLCAKNLGELAQDNTKGVLNGKIAFIHVDGNSFGHLRRELCTTQETREQFDHAIQEGFRTPFLRALLQRANQDVDFQTKDEDGRDALRLEVLLWGGDEITLVVPAWKGWEVLQLFFEQARLLTFSGVPLSHRAAIVFCHANAPILQVRRIASDLLHRTKEDIKANLDAHFQPEAQLSSLSDFERSQLKARLSDHHYGNACHYLTLESFDMLRGSLNSFLKDYYKEATYSSLLIYAHELDELRHALQTTSANIARSKVLAIIKRFQDKQPQQLQAIVDQACSLLDGERRKETRVHIEWLTKEDPARWYVLADLWDYIPEWKA